MFFLLNWYYWKSFNQIPKLTNDIEPNWEICNFWRIWILLFKSHKKIIMGHLLMFKLKFKSWIDSIMRVMSCKTTFGQIVTLNEKCRLRMWHRSRHCTMGNFREFSNNSARWENFHDFLNWKTFQKDRKIKIIAKCFEIQKCLSGPHNF